MRRIVDKEVRLCDHRSWPAVCVTAAIYRPHWPVHSTFGSTCKKKSRICSVDRLCCVCNVHNTGSIRFWLGFLSLRKFDYDRRSRRSPIMYASVRRSFNFENKPSARRHGWLVRWALARMSSPENMRGPCEDQRYHLTHAVAGRPTLSKKLSVLRW